MLVLDSDRSYNNVPELTATISRNCQFLAMALEPHVY
jgi:hypothetical protein